MKVTESIKRLLDDRWFKRLVASASIIGSMLGGITAFWFDEPSSSSPSFIVVLAVMLTAIGAFITSLDKRRLTRILASSNLLLAKQNFQRLSSEAAKMATSKLIRDGSIIILLLAIALVGNLFDINAIEDTSLYLVACAIIIFGYRALLIYRVYMGWFGLNEFEAAEFISWLQKKSNSGDNNFSGKAIEKLREEYKRETASWQEA